jgi:hypothetical protein
MTTPTHAILNLFLLYKKSDPSIGKYIFVGSILPDIPTFLFFPLMLALGKSGREIWDVTYFEQSWQVLWSVSHSLWIWPLCLLVSIVSKWKKLQYFFGSMILHIIVDFCVHASDAYSHFWPFNNWRFYSPISYYEPSHYGDVVSFLESIMFVICSYFVYQRIESKMIRAVILLFSFILIGVLLFRFINFII